MSYDPEQVEEYRRLVSDWVDKVTPMIDAFRKQFPGTAEGMLQYLLALEFMLSEFCTEYHVPREAFTDMLTTLTGTWFKCGKPENIAFGCMSQAQFERIKKSQIN